ncbi:hypothetical protein D9M68_794410 [compost metagenome]
MSVQQLQLGILGDAIGALTLGAEPEPVDVATHPAGSGPGQGAAFIGILVFELVEQEEAVQAAVMHRVARQRWKRGLTVSISEHRNGRAAGGSRRLGRTMAHLGMIHGAVIHPAHRPRHGAVIHLAVIHALHRGLDRAMAHLGVIHRHAAVAHGRMIHFRRQGGTAAQGAQRHGQREQGVALG